MRRWDGTRIWYPNVKLGAMPLLNMSRSDAKVELFKVNLLAQWYWWYTLAVGLHLKYALQHEQSSIMHVEGPVIRHQCL